MKNMDSLLHLSGQFEPFVPSVHLCSLTESMSVLVGLDSMTRQAALPAVPVVTVVLATPAAAATLPVEAPARTAPPQPTLQSFTSRRKDYLPALQDPALIQALLQRAPRSQQPPTQRAAPGKMSPSTSPPRVHAAPKRRPLGSSSWQSYTVPILSTRSEDHE